ncbi:hypothetical protein J2785_001749 [Burkholderia ambifaria]|nr:hypothetical protein [Burkholderia ambifaria]
MKNESPHRRSRIDPTFRAARYRAASIISTCMDYPG